ncbi:unnamed protein product [Prunus armeniaca]
MEMDHVGCPLDCHVGFGMGTPCKPCKKEEDIFGELEYWATTKLELFQMFCSLAMQTTRHDDICGLECWAMSEVKLYTVTDWWVASTNICLQPVDILMTHDCFSTGVTERQVGRR